MPLIFEQILTVFAPMKLESALPRLIVGWVHCHTGRDELVAVNEAQRDALLAGALPCPACSAPCGPHFEITRVSSDIKVARWRDEAWRHGFLLREA